MFPRKHFQSETFKQNSSSAKHEECSEMRPSFTTAVSGRTNSNGGVGNGTSSGNRIVTVLCVAFVIATLVSGSCAATSTDSQNVNGTSDIRSIRDGDYGGNNSNSRAGEEQPKQSGSPSLHSNLVAANFSTVAPIRSPANDTDAAAAPQYYLELQDAVEGEATAKERAMYVQQLETNFAKLKRRIPIYQNEFAVHIPSGAEVADRIAHKYGFENMGQVRKTDSGWDGEHLFLHKALASGEKTSSDSLLMTHQPVNLLSIIIK